MTTGFIFAVLSSVFRSSTVKLETPMDLGRVRRESSRWDIDSLDESFLLEQLELRPGARNITFAQPRRVDKVEVDVVDAEL